MVHPEDNSFKGWTMACFFPESWADKGENLVVTAGGGCSESPIRLNYKEHT